MFKLKTDKELILELQRENKALKAENIELKEKSEANIIATKKMLRVDELTNEELIELKNIYPKWRDKEDFVLDEFVRYEDKLYKVIQAHARQDDWTPGISASLFTEVTPAGVIPEWVQPTGAHDAYGIGDKVIFGGQVYESTIDANTYSPTEYPAGWNLVE